MRIALAKFGKSVLSVAALSSGLLLAGCENPGNSTVSVVVIGVPEAPFESGARLSVPAQLVRAATVEGLVGFDGQGRIIPALAERWIVTDDGQSYIFRLRDGIWRDGSPVTAQSARDGLRDAIASLRGTPLALDLTGVDDIRVMAGRVIEIRLERPMPNLLQLLAQPELGLRRKGRFTGPMSVTRDGKVAVLSPVAPERRGLPAEEGWSDRVRPLRLEALSATQAVERFNRGDADVLLGGRIESFPLASSIGLARGTIQLDPVIGLFGLIVTRAQGFLAAPENREALALAIDRPALIVPFGLEGWAPANRLVAPGLPGDPGSIGDRWTQLPIAERQALAAERVSRWRAADEDGQQVRLSIALPDGPGADALFTRLRDDFGAVGIEAVRVAYEKAADLRLVDAVARYPSATWFLNQFNCEVQRGPCSEDADALVAEAGRTADPAVRDKLLVDAEAELTKANVFIPFGPPVRWSLVRGSAVGFAVNGWGVHPLMPMARRPK